MLRRPLLLSLLLVCALAGISAALYAQLETGDRGILPLDSSGTLDIGGIHVDVGGTDAQSARYAGWRIAQRQGFKALWAKMHNAPIGEAPNLPDGTLDQIVSSINVEREQIGPNRYIADLGVLFDRAKAAEFLGLAGGEIRRSQPMLLIPVMISGGTATTVELRNAWQKAWAEFRVSQSPIDYVRVSGMGADPILVNASLTQRPGRGWWRNLIDSYGASDVLVAEVQLQRLYPGGPAKARFIGRHGPDNEIVGGFELTAPNSEAIPAMMEQGAVRMDQMFAQALADGRLQRDSSLDLPPPPIQDVPEVAAAPVAQVAAAQSFQIQISGSVNVYNFAMAHLRTMSGVESATPQQINPGGTSYVLVAFHGNVGQLAAALQARGWTVAAGGTVIKLTSSSDKPPALPPPPAPAPAAPPPAQPTPAQANRR